MKLCHTYRIENLRHQFVLMALAQADIGVISQVWENVKDPINEQINRHLPQLINHIRWRTLLGVVPR
jgi:hypothetical protein